MATQVALVDESLVTYLRWKRQQQTTTTTIYSPHKNTLKLNKFVINKYRGTGCLK